jgi:putative acetyltransferase
LYVLRHRVLIRAEEQRDWAAVWAVNAAAFETSAEADLVAALREQARPVVSLVAEDGAAIVGHILFSPVSLPGHSDLKIMGLAPMAVVPDQQRKGVGSALVRMGLEECKRLGFGAVVVLGHPGYYPRFGFLPAVRFGIGCQYDVADEVFMLVELHAGYLRGASGKVEYHEAFNNV